jgi:hypothetical protein
VSSKNAVFCIDTISYGDCVSGSRLQYWYVWLQPYRVEKCRGGGTVIPSAFRRLLANEISAFSIRPTGFVNLFYLLMYSES